MISPNPSASEAQTQRPVTSAQGGKKSQPCTPALPAPLVATVEARPHHARAGWRPRAQGYNLALGMSALSKKELMTPATWSGWFMWT